MLGPVQVGCGTPSGCEAVAHSCRRHCMSLRSSDEAKVLAQVDFVNALTDLEASQALTPTLVPWVGWTDGSVPHLRISSDQIESDRGVQQGDPLFHADSQRQEALRHPGLEWQETKETGTPHTAPRRRYEPDWRRNSWDKARPASNNRRRRWTSGEPCAAGSFRQPR